MAQGTLWVAGSIRIYLAATALDEAPVDQPTEPDEPVARIDDLVEP